MVLEQIGAHEIGRIEVMNKRDLLGEAQLEALSIRFPHAVFTSTKTKEGLDELIHRISVVSQHRMNCLNCLYLSKGEKWFLYTPTMHHFKRNVRTEGTHLVVRANNKLLQSLLSLSKIHKLINQ